MDRAQLADFLRTRRGAATGGRRPAPRAAPPAVCVGRRSRRCAACRPTTTAASSSSAAPCLALLGDDSRWTGLARSLLHRWFTDPTARLIHPVEDHPMHSRNFVAHLRQAYGRGLPPRGTEILESLLATSPDFADLWAEHSVEAGYQGDRKRISHPDLGVLDLNCQTLIDPDQSQTLMVYTAVPGSDSYEKLQMLSAVG